MKKCEQQEINFQVEDFVRSIGRGDIIETGIMEERLRKCAATVKVYMHKDTGVIVFLLCSFGTIVAAFDTDNRVCYDFLRYVYGYTARSAEHIRKFKSDYCDYKTKTMMWREV